MGARDIIHTRFEGHEQLDPQKEQPRTTRQKTELRLAIRSPTIFGRNDMYCGMLLASGLVRRHVSLESVSL